VTVLAAGQVHKIVRVIGTSPTSWEAASQAAVAEAAKTIQDLGSATLVEADLLVGDGQVAQYRVKLEMVFQLDRSRLSQDGAEVVRVRRYLVVANQTLASPALHQIIAERDSTGPAEFHVLVPESPRPAVPVVDPAGRVDITLPATEHDRLIALQEAEERLESFRQAFAHLGGRLSGEVGLGDPLAAARRVMEYASFDEIIVSTLPPGVSRWLKMDLPNRLHRAFDVPVIPLIQE
jgi:flavin-binding protein dodecin